MDPAVVAMLPYLGRMIESMGEAVLVIDPSGLVVAANQSAADLLDLESKEAARRPIDEYDQLIRSWQLGEEVFAPTELRKALQGEAIPRQLATITTAAGIEHIIEFTATPIQDDKGNVILAMLVASDVTRQHRLGAYWHTVTKAARGVSTDLVVDRVVESVLDQVVESLGGQVVIGVWGLDGEQLDLLAQRGLSEETVSRLRHLPLNGASMISESARTREVKAIEDARTVSLASEDDRLLCETEGVVSWISSPLLSGEKLVGALSYGLRIPHRMYEDDVRAVEVIAGFFAVALDHAQLYQVSQEATREAERARAELAAVLESVGEGVAVVSSDGQVVLVNEAGRGILGLPEDAEVGDLQVYQTLQRTRLDGTSLPYEESPVGRSLAGEEFTGFEYLLTRTDGLVRRVSSSGCPIRDRDGRVLLSVNTFRDVTEVRELEKSRDTFLSLAAHELKTPITALRAFSQHLVREHARTGILDPAQVLYALSRIDEQTKRLSTLSEGLLDVSRLETGKLSIHLQEADLSSIIENALASVKEVYPSRTFRFQGSGAVIALVDPLRTEQVIVNLLDNAAKFSPKDAPVEVELAIVGEDEAEVSVRDHGKGMSEEDREKVFERFYQVHKEEHIGGMGLGLYIASQIVQMQGGTITSEAPEGAGSRFVVRLPLRGGDERSSMTG